MCVCVCYTEWCSTSRLETWEHFTWRSWQCQGFMALALSVLFALIVYFKVIMSMVSRSFTVLVQTALIYCKNLTNYWVFYRAMLCIRGTSHGPVSVRPSVTSRCSTKTAKRRITQTTPHDSPGTLVFGCQRSLRNSTGVSPCGGAKYRWGGSKSATFDK